MVDMAKVRPDELGIKPQALSTVNPVAQAIEQSIAKPQAEREAMIGARMLRDQSSFLRTPPNASGVASPNVFSGPVPGSTTAQGIVPRMQASTAPPVAVAHERFAPEAPRTYVPPEPTYTTLPNGTRVITQAGHDEMQLDRALADAKARSEGRPDTLTRNTWRGAPTSAATAAAPTQPSGFRGTTVSGNVTTSFDDAGKRTVSLGTPTAPSLMSPVSRVEPKIIGWRGQNAIYADPAAEIAARNQGINAYNAALVNRFGAENTLYSTVTGGVPLQQAQALLAGTSAAEMPGENKSQQGFRDAQRREALANASLLSAKADVAGMPEPPKVHYGEIESITPGGGVTKTPYGGYIDRAGNYQVATPKDSFSTVAASLSPEQKSIAAKHMKKGQTQEEQSSIFMKVKNGELK